MTYMYLRKYHKIMQLPGTTNAAENYIICYVYANKAAAI